MGMSTVALLPRMGCAGLPAARLLAAGLLAAGLLAGCATPPVDAVEERLDRDTGTTVTRLSRPVELLATAPRERNADPFAYLAPFETNRAGERRLFLWASTADDGTAMPNVHCGDELAAPLEAPLAGGMPAVGMGLTRLPYRAPAVWHAAHVIPIDATWIDCLASGARLEIGIGEDRFASDGSRSGDLAQFGARVRE